MRIAHVASFLGNVGDNASHAGLYSIFSKFFPNFVVDKIEIRRFYRNYRLSDQCFFDQDFIELVNAYDLLVIGGGGFLDYWLPGSRTGTTIDIDPELIKSIKVPTLITSVGCVPHKPVPPENLQRFRNFLDSLLANPKVKLSIRNDGSVDSFRFEVGDSYLSAIPEIIDNGFFYSVPGEVPRLFPKNYIAINISFDQISMQNKKVGKIDKHVYQDELASIVNYICTVKGIPVVLVPHIPADLSAISELLSNLDDFIVRKYISVAPCVQYDEGANLIFSVYKHSLMVLATRYHANVCSLSMGTPTVGLAALDRIVYLYQNLGIPDYCVLLSGSFSEPVTALIDSTLNGGWDSRGVDARINSLRESTVFTYSEMLRGIGCIGEV